MRHIFMTLLLVSVPFTLRSQEQPKDLVEADVQITVIREDERMEGFQTVVGIFRKDQETFGKPDEKQQSGDNAKFPKFFKVEGTDKKQKIDMKLLEGDYRFEIILKKSLAACDLGGTKTNAICLPLKEDRYCRGETFESSRRKTAILSLECKGGD